MLSQSAKAQYTKAYQEVLLWTSATTYTSYRCENQPKLVNTESELIWKVGSNEIHLPRTSNITFTFPINPDDDAIKEIHRDGSVLLKGNELTISDVPAGTPLLMYDLEGRMVKKELTSAAGDATLTLSGIRRGTYIVRCGNINFKFQKQ